MTTEATPDPVTDNEAYTALRAQSWALQAEIRRIEIERARNAAAEEMKRQWLATEKHAATLAERYPNPVPEQVFDLAEDAAAAGEDTKDSDVEVYYEAIVKIINAAMEKSETTAALA